MTTIENENTPKTYKEISDRLQAIMSEEKELKAMLTGNIAAKLRGTDVIIGRLRAKEIWALHLGSFFMDPYDRNALPDEMTELPIEDAAFRQSLIEFLEGWVKVWADEFDREQKEMDYPF